MKKRKVKVIDEKTNKKICEYTIDDQAIIQCYSPDWWHNPQAIVMNQKGRETLLKALQEGKEKTVIDAMVTDGEGYHLSLIIMNADKIDDEYISPYVDEICQGHDEGKKNPIYEGYELLKNKKQQES